MQHDVTINPKVTFTINTTTPVKRPVFQDDLGKPVSGKTSLNLNEVRDDCVLGCSGSERKNNQQHF